MLGTSMIDTICGVVFDCPNTTSGRPCGWQTAARVNDIRMAHTVAEHGPTYCQEWARKRFRKVAGNAAELYRALGPLVVDLGELVDLLVRRGLRGQEKKRSRNG